MCTRAKFLSPIAATLFAASLAACTAGAEPQLASHEAAIASQEVTYTYYDCANPDISVGWRFHACVATNAWSSDGTTSSCFEVDSQDCSNPVGTIEYCAYNDCGVFDINDPDPLTYEQWFYSH